jgi:hypothetical protein
MVVHCVVLTAQMPPQLLPTPLPMHANGHVVAGPHSPNGLQTSTCVGLVQSVV